MLHNGAIKVFVMFEEEEVSERRVDDFRGPSAHLHKFQPLFTTVSTSPYRCAVLLFPWWPSVCLNRHHIQAYSVK